MVLMKGPAQFKTIFISLRPVRISLWLVNSKILNSKLTSLAILEISSAFRPPKIGLMPNLNAS